MKNSKKCNNSTTIANENIVSDGDFNLNLLDFHHSTNVKIYVKEVFKNNHITMMNKNTRVTSKSIFAIDHVNTSFLLNSDYFFYNLRTFQKVLKDTEYTRKTQTIYKMIFTEKQIGHPN